MNWWNEFLNIVQKNANDPLIINTTPEELNTEFKNIPYFFNPENKTRTYKQALRDNSAACAEAAAAIAASLSVRKIPFEVCYKYDDLTNGAHVVIIANGRIFDPYKNYFPSGVSCVAKPEFFPL